MIISVALVFNWHIVMVENNNNNKGDDRSETSQDIVDNLKEIEELDKEMKERRKKEKETEMAINTPYHGKPNEGIIIEHPLADIKSEFPNASMPELVDMQLARYNKQLVEVEHYV